MHGDFPQDHPGGHQIGIGHDLGRRQPQRRVLQQDKGHRTGRDRHIDQRHPDDGRQRRPVRGPDRRPGPKRQQHGPRHHHPEGEDDRRLAPIQAADQRRIGGMGDAAPEIDHLARTDPHCQQGGQIGPEDHPKRANRPDCQRKHHPPGQPLAQEQPAKPRCHQRGQGKDRRRGYRLRCLQPLEHQHEIGGQQPAQHQITPGCYPGPARQAGCHQRRDPDQRPRQQKPKRRHCGGVYKWRRQRAQRKRPRHQRRERQHRQMPACSLAHVPRDQQQNFQSFAASFRWVRKA